ncbi:MAG: glycosyl transferase family A [Acidobacteria bacterium]|nr:MAG: glycosyl transferase family A [Acidobacteriota bacterium]
MHKPLVSVIIPSYNYARYIGEAIDSVLAQTYANVEVVVVDNSSTDNTLEVLRGYGDSIRWFQQPNQGVSGSRNRGIVESGGELVAFLDADDVWLPEKLARQVEFFNDPCIGMVYCGLQFIDALGNPLERSVEGLRGQVLKRMALLEAPGIPACGSSAIVRREALEKAGGFDRELSISADWDMWRRISCHYDVEFLPEPLVLYRQHDSAMHLKVDVFAHDMLHAFESMFSDAAAREVHPLRRRCYANLYAQLSGSYHYAGQWRKSIRYGIKSALLWPPRLAYLLAFPYRRWQRRAAAKNSSTLPATGMKDG